MKKIDEDKLYEIDQIISNININPDRESFYNIFKIFVKAPFKFSEGERQYIENRFKNKEVYEKLYELHTFTTNKLLGFDVNEKFGISLKEKNKMGLLGTPQHPKHHTFEISQSKLIVINDKTVKKIMSNEQEKNYLYTLNFTEKTNNNFRNFQIDYYATVVDNQIVPITVTKKSTRFSDGMEKYYNQSIDSVSVHILLKGMVPLLFERYDLSSTNTHSNTFSQDGNIATKKDRVSGPHVHRYSEKCAVVFPLKDFLGHYDAYPLQNINTHEEVCDLLKNKYNFTDEKNPVLDPYFQVNFISGDNFSVFSKLEERSASEDNQQKTSDNKQSCLTNA